MGELCFVFIGLYGFVLIGDKQDLASKMVKIYLVKKEDPYYSDEGPSDRDLENRWRYYIANYTSLEDTSGIDKKQLSPVLLVRNIHALGADSKSERFPPLAVQASETTAENQDANTHGAASTSQETGTDSNGVGERLLSRFLSAKNDERLILRIAVNNYHPIFQPGTAEGFFEDLWQREGGEEGVKMAEETRDLRKEGMIEGFLMMNAGMKGLTKEGVEGRNEGFVALKEGRESNIVKGEVVEGGVVEGDGEKMEVDE